MKIVVWGFNDASQAQAIRSLEQDGVLKVVRWFRNDSQGREIDQIIHTPDSILNEYDCCLEDALYEYFHPLKIKFLEMYSRVTISQCLDINEHSVIFDRYVKYFYKLFIKTQPQALLMGSPPHFGADFLLYHMAIYFDIKVSVCLQTLFENRFYSASRIEQFGDIPAPKQNVPEETLNEYRNKQQFYMSRVQTFNKSCWSSFINNALLGRRKRKPMSLAAAFKNFNLCVNFKKSVSLYAIVAPDLHQKFVYVPLQLQPEMTTSTLGGKLFSDQLNMIDVLLRDLPEDVQVYVKENPKQTPRQRSHFFFEHLLANPRVKYVSPIFSSKTLIDHCVFVAVVTGTAGWEAILSGKPSVTFGYAWFNNLPGIFRYQDGFDYQQVVRFKSDQSVLAKHFNGFLCSLNQGVVDPSYNVIVKNYSEAKNEEYLKIFIKGFVND